jgi:hypothetical protein
MSSASDGIGGGLPPQDASVSGLFLTTTTSGSLSTASWASLGAGGGVTTVGTFGSTPTANAMTISGVTLTGQPADGTHPGFLTSGTQTIGGLKTFTSALTAPGGQLGVYSTFPGLALDGSNAFNGGMLLVGGNTTYLEAGAAGFNFQIASNSYVTLTTSVLALDAGAAVRIKMAYTDISGTPGNGTASTPTGRFAIASSASAVTVTNTLVSATSIVLCQVETALSTALTFKCVPGSGSFVVTTGAVAPTNIVFSFVLFNS